MNPVRLPHLCRRLSIALFTGLLVQLLTCVGAQAAVDPLGFQLQVPAGGLFVHEDAGAAVITVTRSPDESGFSAQIRYVTSGDGYDPQTNAPFQCGGMVCTATEYDYTPVKGELDFAAGQTSATFSIPVVDHHQQTVPTTLQVALFGPSPGSIGLGPNSSATLTILNDDPVAPPIAGDPLGVGARSVSQSPAAGPPLSDPLLGAHFFVDPQSEAATAARAHPALRVIADQPGTARFGAFSFTSPYVPTIGTAVSRYLARAAAEEPGTVPLLSTYRIIDGACRSHPNGDSPAQEQSYEDFIQGFAQGIGSYPAVLFLEMDSLITSPCLTANGLSIRLAELNYAIDTLTADCPHLVIYVDAGAADALRVRNAAHLLERAGVSKIQGFFLNSTHFDWTLKEIRYGEQISRMTGGKHFVVNTGVNGRGPLRPKNIVKQGNEVLCNPPGRGLGPKPTADTGFPNVDMFAWIGNPGESGGACVPGAPGTGVYWPAYALMLVRNAVFKVT
jgi:endoglucanase